LEFGTPPNTEPHPTEYLSFHTISRSQQSIFSDGWLAMVFHQLRSYNVAGTFSKICDINLFVFSGYTTYAFQDLPATYHFLFTTLASFSGATWMTPPLPWYEECLTRPRLGHVSSRHVSGERPLT
jgi:hypothetical protein